MPLRTLVDDNILAWAVWYISEDEKTLSDELAPYEPVPAGTTNKNKRLEFLAGRVVLKRLLSHWNLTFTGLEKDQFGKPFFRDSNVQLSLSHSFPYVAAAIHRVRRIGIDVEQPKAKLLNVAPRILDIQELSDAGADLIKHCIIWCGKEAMIKYHGRKDLTFAKELKIDPFMRFSHGQINGRIIAKGNVELVPMLYRVYDNFVFVITI
ncbi:MAG TPA: 4'-phosphopantetheinyl transferase superfamily protein [Chryseosolibacter sp.]|nr:4'-phosphopantetheinyl transferase superfamily protein [Chryseosolibacter sp.]